MQLGGRRRGPAPRLPPGNAVTDQRPPHRARRDSLPRGDGDRGQLLLHVQGAQALGRHRRRPALPCAADPRVAEPVPHGPVRDAVAGAEVVEAQPLVHVQPAQNPRATEPVVASGDRATAPLRRRERPLRAVTWADRARPGDRLQGQVESGPPRQRSGHPGRVTLDRRRQELDRLPLRRASTGRPAADPPRGTSPGGPPVPKTWPPLPRGGPLPGAQRDPHVCLDPGWRSGPQTAARRRSSRGCDQDRSSHQPARLKQ